MEGVESGVSAEPALAVVQILSKTPGPVGFAMMESPSQEVDEMAFVTRVGHFTGRRDVMKCSAGASRRRDEMTNGRSISYYCRLMIDAPD